MTSQPRTPLPDTRYEQLLESYRESSDGLSSLLAGASRLTRVDLPQPDADRAALRDVAAGVLAPALVCFCVWLLRRAHQLGLRRLYFVSRDGQLPLEVASRLIERLEIDIELRYFRCSRKALVPCCVTEVNTEQIGVAFEESPFVSVRSCLDRIGIAPEQLAEPLRDAGFESCEWDRNLDVAQRVELRRTVLNTPAVGARILENARERRDVLLDYLRQEGVLSGEPCGLVDLGWYANMQRALARLINGLGKDAGGAPDRPIHPFGLYFGLHAVASDDASPFNGEGYFFDEEHQTGLLSNELPQLAAIVEPMCTAAHGMVTGFRREGDKVEPTYDPEGSVYGHWEFDLLRQTVHRFADGIGLRADDPRLNGDARQAIHDLFVAFWQHPTRHEAAVWGRLPLGDRLGRRDLAATFARPFFWGDVPNTYRRAHINVPSECIWFRGCFRQAHPVLRLALKVANKLGAVRNGVQQRRGDGK